MAELDLLTDGEARDACNVGEDADIALLVSAVSAAIDEMCGPVVAREVVAVFEGGRQRILLPGPVLEVTLVEEDRGVGNVVELDPIVFGVAGGDYRFVGAGTHDPYLERAGWWPAQVRVTYMAGRVETTDDVPARFKKAAGVALGALYRRDSGAWAQSSSFFEAAAADSDLGAQAWRALDSKKVRELLAGELRPRVVA